MSEPPREFLREGDAVETQQTFRIDLVFCPHDRRPSSFQWQNGERSAGQEMLIGSPPMLALMRDRSRQATLAVGPTRPANSRGFPAQRPGAIRPDDEGSLHATPVGKDCTGGIDAEVDTVEPAAGLLDLCAVERAEEARVQAGGLHHLGQVFALAGLLAERQEGRPDRVVEPRIGDGHLDDRLALAREHRPHAEHLQHSTPRGGDRVGTGIGTCVRALRRLRQDDPRSRAERLPHGEGGGQRHDAASRDQHVGTARFHCRGQRPAIRVSLHWSFRHTCHARSHMCVFRKSAPLTRRACMVLFAESVCAPIAAWQAGMDSRNGCMRPEHLATRDRGRIRK